MGQGKGLTARAVGSSGMTFFFPLQEEKLFSLVHFKFPNGGEVSVLDKCHLLHRVPENANVDIPKG